MLDAGLCTELLERAPEAQAHQLRAGQTADLLKGALEKAGRARREVVDVLALADLDVLKLRVDRQRDVGRQRPGRGRPDQKVLARPIDNWQRQVDRGVGQVAV